MAEKLTMEWRANEDISSIDSFDLNNKKKKKKKKIHDGSLNNLSEATTRSLSSEDEEEGELGIARYPWEGTEGDYGYEKLLGRVFSMLHENNPKLGEDRCRMVLRLPEVLQDGTKNTVFVNFVDLCKMMHRQPNHFMTFLLTEMDTRGSLDGQDRLVFKGRFASKTIDLMLRRYIDEYVICHICKSPDTILTQEDRLFVVGCDQCGSERSV